MNPSEHFRGEKRPSELKLGDVRRISVVSGHRRTRVAYGARIMQSAIMHALARHVCYGAQWVEGA